MILRPFSCIFHPIDNNCANLSSPYFPRSFLRAGQSPQNVGEHSLGYMPNGPTIDYRLSTIRKSQPLFSFFCGLPLTGTQQKITATLFSYASPHDRHASKNHCRCFFFFTGRCSTGTRQKSTAAAFFFWSMLTGTHRKITAANLFSFLGRRSTGTRQ